MPGTAFSRAFTTRFNEGTAEISLRIRRIRRDRSMDNEPVAGNSAIPTTVASKMFVRSALIRKNLVVDYLEKDVMQTHLVN